MNGEQPPRTRDDQHAEHEGSKPLEGTSIVDPNKPDEKKHSTRTESAKYDEPPDNLFGRIKGWWRDPYRDRAKWTDKAIAFLTAGIVFLAWMQWREMHDSGKQTDQIIESQKRLAVAMENSVLAANKALNATIDAAHRDQRAWIGAAEGTFVIDTKTLMAGVIVKNVGKTPAIEVSSNILESTEFQHVR